MDEYTSVLETIHTDGELIEAMRPRIFICEGRSISEHILSGHQTFGRVSEANEPDIMIPSRFVSRRNGWFDTVGVRTTYTAEKTTNGILFHGVMMTPGETIELRDGDELFIPYAGEDESDSIMIVYVNSPLRINVWHELMETGRDRLTGLFLRTSFLDWWAQHCRNKDYENAALFMLDADDFKQINDQLGHNSGDLALQLIADHLTKSVRYERQLCRWGGDEFIGIIPGSMEAVERRLHKLADAITKSGKEKGIPITVSIGYADLKDVKERTDIEGLVELADQAMYRIKQSGKNGICRYDAQTLK